jgi:ankyrin repeat protein
MYLQSDNNHPPPKTIVAAQRGDHAEMTSLVRRRANIEQPHPQTGRTPLAVACHCGHEDIVDLLIAEGAKLHTRDRFQLCPIHLAAANGHCKVIDALLDRNADINARGPNNKTPLRIACDHGQLDAIRTLIRRRAMVDSRDQRQRTPLHAAAEVGDDEIVKLLLQHGANKDAKDSQMRSPLHTACSAGRVAVVDILLNAKADVEAQEEENMTPLTMAAKSGLTAVMEVLLRHKASPRAISAGDFTPLHWASFNGHEESVEILVRSKKAEINYRSVNGRTPLHVAAMGRSFGVIEKLLKAGANIEATCQENFRPVHYACMYATHSEVSLLLNSGADCNTQTIIGETPLHLAVKTNSTKVVRTLLSRGARVDRIDNQGLRPLTLACSTGNLEIVQLLLDHGAVLRGSPGKGVVTDSPMCVAAKGGFVSVIQALIQRGGAVREIDSSNWDPLRYACFMGHVEAVACLLGNGARATDLGPLASFSFSSTTTPEQRSRIYDLLDLAIRSENDEYQRVTYLASAATAINTDSRVELPNDYPARTSEDAGISISNEQGSGDSMATMPPTRPAPGRPPPTGRPPIPAIRYPGDAEGDVDELYRGLQGSPTVSPFASASSYGLSPEPPTMTEDSLSPFSPSPGSLSVGDGNPRPSVTDGQGPPRPVPFYPYPTPQMSEYRGTVETPGSSLYAGSLYSAYMEQNRLPAQAPSQNPYAEQYNPSAQAAVQSTWRNPAELA